MTRRWLTGVAALGLAVPAAPAPASDQFKTPIVAGYQPQDKDERGLWMQVEEVERKLKTSNFVVRDEALNAYVRQVFCRTVGQTECAGVRLYLLRTADFNASMYPNGMMVVYTGLLLRMRNEAQLAAVLGHEYTHFAHRHSLQNFRNVKSKATIAAWLSVIPVASYGAAVLLSTVRLGIIGSIFHFSRDMEREADAGSIPMLAQAGYDPHEASRIWEQLRSEMDATAAARHKRSRKNDDDGFFADHPPTAERVGVLRGLADAQATGAGDSRRPAYRLAMATWWPQLIDDQIKLNDFGGTDFLLADLARDGAAPEVLYARGELYRTRGRPEDLPAAASYYRQASAMPGAPAEAWRGLGLVELRAGHANEGKAALSDYLAKKPDASDRAMMTMLAGGTN